MAITGNLAKIAAASIFIFLVTSDKWGVMGCSGGGSGGGSTDDCEYGKLSCDDGKKCYTEEQKCNGNKDCDDNSDEDNHHCGTVVISFN